MLLRLRLLIIMTITVEKGDKKALLLKVNLSLNYIFG